MSLQGPENFEDVTVLHEIYEDTQKLILEQYSSYYENMLMKYTDFFFFSGENIENFSRKNNDLFFYY